MRLASLLRFLLVFTFLACNSSSASSASSASSSSRSSVSALASSSPAAAPLTGKLANAPFSPSVVLLLRDADGVHLAFYQTRTNRERWRCEEPLGDLAASLEARAHGDWVIGAPVETPLADWTLGDGARAPEGTVRVTIDKRDADAFTFSGTIDVESADGSSSLSGPFTGEYCPTKVVEREHPEPLAGVAWTDGALDASTIPTTPIASVLAGVPSPIAKVALRSIRSASGLEDELVFYRDAVADPCGSREGGSWLTSYDASTGKIKSRHGPKVRADYFAVALTKPAAAGDTFAALKSRAARDADRVRAVSLYVFEPDGFRATVYDRYFSLAITFDAVDATHATGRIALALPDAGKSMLAGAFDAVKCPPSDE